MSLWGAEVFSTSPLYSACCAMIEDSDAPLESPVYFDGARDGGIGKADSNAEPLLNVGVDTDSTPPPAAAKKKNRVVRQLAAIPHSLVAVLRPQIHTITTAPDLRSFTIERVVYGRGPVPSDASVYALLHERGFTLTPDAPVTGLRSPIHPVTRQQIAAALAANARDVDPEKARPKPDALPAPSYGSASVSSSVPAAAADKKAAAPALDCKGGADPDCAKASAAAGVVTESGDCAEVVVRYAPTFGPYKNGVFRVRLIVAWHYPTIHGPSVSFLTRVYHPNVSASTGAFSADALRSPAWRAATGDLALALRTIDAAFIAPDLAACDTLNAVAADELRDKPELFALHVAQSMNGLIVHGEQYPRVVHSGLD